MSNLPDIPATPGEYPTMWQEIRASRGRNVANSRPLPRWVDRFTWLLDDAFAVPATEGQRRVGIDGLLSLIPVAGDPIAIGLSLVVVVVGVGAGVSIPTVLRMLVLVGFEALVGLIPFVGALFNMWFKANTRNLALIEADLADRRGTRRSSLGVLIGLLLVLFAGAVMLFVAFALSIFVLWWIIAKLLGAL